MNDSIMKFALKNALTHDGKAQVGAIVPKMIGEDNSLKDKIKDLMKEITKVVSEVNKMSLKEQLRILKERFPEMLTEKKDEGKELPPLPGNPKKVVMRFAPFPSGPLHIGNARPLVLNDEYVRKYKGKLLLVIDDTIGSTQKPIEPDAYKLIPEGLDWLNVNYDKKIIYKSDRLSLFYKYGEELIKKGTAYVCECPSEVIRDYRVKGIECEHRDDRVKSNLSKWKRMLEGKYDEGESCVRLKTSMSDKDPAFRDRVLFRVSKRSHPRTGVKYCVWPLLEMSWAVDDYLLGITHIIRGKDLYMEDKMEMFIWGALGWSGALTLHNGLVRLEGVKISKSKSKKEVESGAFSGWDDPRTWSLQSLKRRGFKPESIREFALSFGMSLNDVTVPIDSLYSINRKLIDAHTNRYFFVKNPVKLVVTGCRKKKASVPLHPSKGLLKEYEVKEGNNTVFFSESDSPLLKKGAKVRLKDLMNIKVGGRGTADFDKDQDEVYDIRKIHYVVEGKHLPCRVLLPDGSVDEGYCESYCSDIKKNEVIQFERYGFCKLDKKTSNGLEFIYAHN